MAHALMTNAHATTAGPAGFFARFRESIVNHQAYLRTRDELSAMSDRDLDDIGVSRHNIEEIAHEAVYGR